MADFSALKTAIQNAIKQNGNEEITGNLLQEVLLAIVTTLGDGSINDLVTALGSEATTRSQADGTLQQNINAEAQARSQADSTLQGGINTAMQAINAINNAITNGCVYAGIATPSSTPASGKIFYLALTAGTYTNYGGLEVPQGINILKNNGSTWLLDSFLSIDDAPTQGSSNLVKSGGVLDSIIKDGSAFDLSAYNNGTTYANLDAALTALNALPADFKKGGMSMKYVQTSDNKYVQYFLNSKDWSTTVSDWQKYNVEPTFGYDSFTEDEYINNNGVVESGGGNWSTTDYIPIIKGEKYVACLRGYKDATSWVAFYDINKNLVSFVVCTSSSYETISGTITDDSIAYCRFSTKNEQNASLYWKIITDANTIKSDFLSLINDNKNERLITPLFSEDGVVEDGGVWNPTYVWKSTQYIPVFEGMVYEVKGVGTATVTLIAFYDEHKDYVSHITYSQNNVVTLYADKIPSGIRYIRCCTKTAYVSNSYIKVENTSNLAKNTYSLTDNIKTLEYGQKWVNIIEEVINTTSINKIYPIAPIKGKVQFNVRIDVADTSDIADWYMPTVYVDYADGTEELVGTVQVSHPFAFYAEKEVVAIRLEKNNTLNWQGTYYLDMFSMDVQNEFDDAKAEPLTYNISGKNIVLFGDSITQGEVATDADNNSYAGILRKMFALEHGGNMNYGFCHFANNRENHGYMVSLVSHVGWTENYSNNSVLGGDSYTTSTPGAELIFKIDKPCNYIKVACKYGTTLGSFKVMQGETVLDTIDLSIDDSGAGVSSAIDVSNVDFSQNFTIKCISGEVVVSGIVCIDNLNWWTYNNYGRSGANPLLFIGSLFEKQASDASVVFYALGANGTKENLESTIASIKNTFKNLNAIKIVLDVNNYSTNRLGKPDSSSPNGTYEKKSLLKYLAEYVGATYICVADHYPKTVIGNVISGFFAEDNLHPTDKGHQFIAELIAKNIGLNVNSKFLAEKLLSNNI